MKSRTFFKAVQLLGPFLLAQICVAPAADAQAVIRVHNVYLQPDDIPEGWRLISSSENSEVFTRILEVQLGTELTSIWTQKFAADNTIIEIEYLGGITEDSTAKAYSQISRQKKADAVCHRGRFAIAIHSTSPDLIRTAIRALQPEPLDRIKLLNVDLPVGQRVQSEALSNLIQREALAKHLDSLPSAVLNQFFEGPNLRQITYLDCGSVDDASQASARVREMCEAKNLVLHEGQFVTEIIGDDSWVQRVRPAVEANLRAVAEEEAHRIKEIREYLFLPEPTNTPTKLRHLR